MLTWLPFLFVVNFLSTFAIARRSIVQRLPLGRRSDLLAEVPESQCHEGVCHGRAGAPRFSGGA